jgi:twinkle protein
MADIGEISKQLASRAENVAAHLLPAGKKVGNEWRVGSVKNEVGDSLGIHLVGSKAGVWCDFASGESGDLVDLWAQVKGISLAAALAEAKSFLGISEPRFFNRERKIYRKPKIAAGTQRLSENSPVMDYLIFERKLKVEALAAYQVAERQNEQGEWQIVFPFKRENE